MTNEERKGVRASHSRGESNFGEVKAHLGSFRCESDVAGQGKAETSSYSVAVDCSNSGEWQRSDAQESKQRIDR